MFTNNKLETNQSEIDPYLIKIKELAIDAEPFDSTGAKGKLYEGEWHNQDVAVKKIKVLTENAVIDCHREKDILKILAEKNAPNIMVLLNLRAGRNVTPNLKNARRGQLVESDLQKNSIFCIG